jgi:hypothetical protein
MGDQTTAKIAEVYFDSILDTWEEQVDMLSLTDYTEPDGGRMQVSGNSYWEGVEQHSNIIEGDDLSGETPSGIIEESVQISLGTLKNVWTSQTAKDMRDTQFWARKGVVDGITQAQRLNTDIANAVAIQGSLFYRSNVDSGFDFMSEGQIQMNERQLARSMRYFMFNDRSSGKFAKDLAARQTLKGRPEEVWKVGQIGKNICDFDPYTGSFLPNLVGGASPDTTVTGDQSFKPEGGTADPVTNTVTNVDYRYAVIPVAASASYNIGDKVKFSNGGTDVNAIGLGDKVDTNEPMTFTITAKPSGTSIRVSPKPIALDDTGLTDHEKSYANINTKILNGANVVRLNTDASAKTNIFWDRDSIKVVGGTLPANMFQEFNSAKVLTKSLPNGLPVYMMYDGDIADLTFRYRVTAWTGVTVCAPQNCGVAIDYV